MSYLLLKLIDELINCFDTHILPKSYEIFHNKLNSPKHIVAPMVLESDLAFRMMTRNYGAQLCYTPMITSKLLIRDYEIDNINGLNKHLKTNINDRPLIVQLCSNDSIEIVKAAKIIENNISCDAIDINLGCPQSRAKHDNFGAFLLKQPCIVSSMVKSLVINCKLPIFAKIRILSTFDDTLKFVEMLINSGISLITIHGRKIHEKHYGEANIDLIHQIKLKINNKIPIISNGNILNYNDIYQILNTTKIDGIMSANAIRKNPYLFMNNSSLNSMHSIDICWEYLEYVERYDIVTTESINRHILQFCHKYFNKEYGNMLKDKKSYKLAQINKLLRWPKICKSMIQFRAILDLLERVVSKKPFKHPNVKIFNVQQIKKQSAYIAYYHKHRKKSKVRDC